MSAKAEIRLNRWTEGSFELELESAPCRGPLEARLEVLKTRLVKQLLRKHSAPELAPEILWAANEAAALAWCTRVPLLVLPALLEEKVANAINRCRKQSELRAGKPIALAA